ncbi:MAG: PASTA domain-containing protein [Desulfatiglandaceae bacterium]
MSIVTIKEVKGVVKCAEDGTAEHVFNIKNNTDKTLKIGMHLSMSEPVSEEWLQIDGSTEHILNVEQMTQVTVKIQVPPDCKPGKYSYRLRVFDPDQPGEVYTDGDPVYFEVPEKVEEVADTGDNRKKPFKWWIPAAIAAAVVVIGLVAWLLMPKDELVKMPKLTDVSFSVALQRINSHGLSFNVDQDFKTVRVADEAKHELVIDQDPDEGDLVAEKSSVKLTVGRFANKRFEIKDAIKLKTMEGIKLSPKFLSREVQPQSE